MLGRLDDKLDEASYLASCPLPQHIIGEPIQSVNHEQKLPTHHQSLTFNTIIGTRPILAIEKRPTTTTAAPAPVPSSSGSSSSVSSSSTTTTTTTLPSASSSPASTIESSAASSYIFSSCIPASASSSSSSFSPTTFRSYPLSLVVSSLVCSWSLGFLDLAREGDSSSQSLVSQMYFSPKGYGALTHDRKKGVEWMLKAIQQKDGDALELAKKMMPEELKEFMKEKGLTEKDFKSKIEDPYAE